MAILTFAFGPHKICNPMRYPHPVTFPILLLTGCSCGSFSAYLPSTDRDYNGFEACGTNGSFGEVDPIDPDLFTLFVSPKIRSHSSEFSDVLIVAYLSRAEMTEGATPAFEPWAVDSESSGFLFTDGEIEVLAIKEKENEGPYGVSLDKVRYRLSWDLTWGEEDSGGVYIHSSATDWIEAWL